MPRAPFQLRHAVVLATACFVLDRATKYFFFRVIPRDIVPSGIVSLVRHQNAGIIANISVPRPLILFVTAIFIGIIVRLLYVSLRNRSSAQTAFLSILLAGALGNFWDRAIHGYVFDWLLLFGRSAVNLADICIFAGLLGFLIATRPPNNTRA